MYLRDILPCLEFQHILSYFILSKFFYLYEPSIFKLVKLLGFNNVKELCGLGKILQLATILRNELLSIN